LREALMKATVLLAVVALSILPVPGLAADCGESANAELCKIFQADQADRKADKIDWSIVGERDKQRRARVLQLMEEGQLKVAEDYVNAAFVFQHGDQPEDYDRAHTLGLKAAELDPTDRMAKWIAAAAKDRYLQSTGKPQIYGTQYQQDESGKWTLEPLDPTVITDEERVRCGVPTLAESRKRVDKMNAGNN
jgi:hypothetical protein